MPSTAPYLLRVNSRPVNEVSPSLWQKWYVEEHVPDLVDSGVSTHAGFYRATNDFNIPLTKPIKETDKEFLAMYQTKFAGCLETSTYQNLRTTSELLPGKNIGPCAEWDVRNYTLIQNYDPNKAGEST